MYGAIAQAAIERRQSLKAAAEERVRTAVAMERARREADKVAERKKRRVKDVLALADKGAMGSLFQMWDRDGSGFIDREEFREQATILCRKHGFEVSDEALKLTWADFDLDGSGSVTYEEWLRITLRDMLVQGNMRIMEAFRAWDRDLSGTIDRREFCDALCTLGFDAPRVLVEEVFDAMDRDGSGTLSFEELNKQLRQGSAVRGRLDDALHAGQVHLDTSRSFKNALRKSPGGGGIFGSGGGGAGAASLVAQMKRHIQTAADSEPRNDATPAAPQPAPQPALPQETNLWVLRMLANVGTRQAASIRHTAVNDDHTTLASAVSSDAAAPCMQLPTPAPLPLFTGELQCGRGGLRLGRDARTQRGTRGGHRRASTPESEHARASDRLARQDRAVAARQGALTGMAAESSDGDSAAKRAGDAGIFGAGVFGIHAELTEHFN